MHLLRMRTAKYGHVNKRLSPEYKSKRDAVLQQQFLIGNTSIMSRKVIDEETVENMLVDIEQAAKKKNLLIEQMQEVEEKDEEILRVRLNHDISDSSHLHSL